MSLISDSELAKITPQAELEDSFSVFYFLGGHAERGNDDVIDDFLSRHPANPSIAAAIADALYEKGDRRENIDKWVELYTMSAAAEIDGLSNNTSLWLGLHFYENEQYDDALKWCLRAAEVFAEPEGALAVGSIYEADESRLDYVQAAKYYILAGNLLAKSDSAPDNMYFKDDSYPVNEKGQWVDFDLLAQWMNELPLDKRNELLDLIKTTPAIAA